VFFGHPFTKVYVKHGILRSISIQAKLNDPHFPPLLFGKKSLVKSIQFICRAHFHRLQICLRVLLQSVHIDIAVPEPHIGSGKTPKQPFTGEKGKKPSAEQQEDPSPRWTGVICNVYRRNHYTQIKTNNTINEYDGV